MTDLEHLEEFLKKSVIDLDKYNVNHIVDIAQREYLMISHKKDIFWTKPREEFK